MVTDSQFIPLDVVKEVPVGSDSLGLDWFKQGLAIVSERTHQVILLITTKDHSTMSTYTNCYQTVYI